MCVCLCAHSACTPLLLAGVCGVGSCASARVLAAPRHSWLRCWGVCVFVWALSLCPATPRWGVRCGWVCLGSVFGCAPPLLAGVLGCVCVCLCACSACTPPLLARLCRLGVCAWARVPVAPPTPGWGVGVCVSLVRAPSVPRHCWLGCAVWAGVIGLGVRLRSATPGWGVGVCVCLCARSACTPPLLAWVCGVGACAWARVSAAPRHSWLGCWGVCVLVWALRLCPATPGWGVRCRCVCLGLGFGCAPPLLAGVLGCVCVFGCLLRLYLATSGWGARCGWPCLGSGFGCGPQLLAGVLGCVCAFVCLPHLYPATPRWVGLAF